MTHPFAAAFAMAIVSFYLIDSAMLLYADELLLVEAKGTWSFALPRFEVLGKRVYLPNPLAPDNLFWRVCWSATDSKEPSDNYSDLQGYLQALLPLRCLSVGLLALVIVVAPVCLLVQGPSHAVLWLFVVIYCLILGMLVELHRKRGILGISRSTFLRLGFDSLICAPLAVNLVRKIALRRQISGDPVVYARDLFDAVTFGQLVEAVCDQIDEQLVLEDEDASQYVSLVGYRDYLKSLVL